MEFNIYILLCLVGAYILGSIPSAVWFGKALHGVDVREHGSKNAGATNVLRVLGAKTAIFVLIVDILKGVAAVFLANLVRDSFSDSNFFSLLKIVLGFLALLGHLFPLMAGFRGGKGVATIAGVVIVIFPQAVLFCLAAFLAFFIPTRYVSLGSIMASIMFPIAVIWIGGTEAIPEMAFSILVATFIIVSHRSNIKRLLNGTENKVYFRKKGSISK
jgi:glycerol-3-phosphate acyltransferase PlsY